MKICIAIIFLCLFVNPCAFAGKNTKRNLQGGPNAVGGSRAEISSGEQDGVPVTLSPADLIIETHLRSRRLGLPGSPGEISISAEDIECALDDQRVILRDLDHSTQLRFFDLFRTWFQLSQTEKDPEKTKAKIKQWLNIWSDDLWLEYASDIFLDVLAFLDCSDAELSRLLQKISLPEEKNAVTFMVRAAQVSGKKQESYYRDAILTGYSHPLPYLRLIENLVSRERYKQAHHIYEMYRLVVRFNHYWVNPSDDRTGAAYWHESEKLRLERIYDSSLETMTKEMDTLGRCYLPDRKRLEASLKAWPKATRNHAEYMLFTRAFDVPWNLHEPAVEFAEAVIERACHRWHIKGQLPEATETVHRYIKNAFAPRALKTLHDKLAMMLTLLGREQKAIDLLYGFVNCYQPGLATDYDQALYLIASAHVLNHRGMQVHRPSYRQALELGRKICASGQSEALGERLVRIRHEAPSIKENLPNLQHLYNSMSELTQFNPKGSMDGLFEDILQRALQEARARGYYRKEVPSSGELSKYYEDIERKEGRLLQLFSPAFEHADIEDITGLFLEGGSGNQRGLCSG